MPKLVKTHVYSDEPSTPNKSKKPTHIASKGVSTITKQLKTHVNSSKSKQTPHEQEEPENFTSGGPAVRRHIPHALAQLRPARTHERIEIEIEIDFPVWGSPFRAFSPPNLR